MSQAAIQLEFNKRFDVPAPDVFLQYQKEWCADQSQVKIGEKSRRIGLTWCEAGDDVLLAATSGLSGMDVFYVGYNQEMAREYIDTCAGWAKFYGKAATEVEETIVKDEDKDILTFRIRFDSGHEILALSSSPSNLRGRQGRVVIDEAAFHPNLEELVKAAMALLMWGGDVRIISTHDGENNYFNQLVEDTRAGKLPYSLHRITLDDALADGLYQRICLIRGIDWSEEAEAVWKEKLIKLYGTGADEELYCIPSKGGGTYLIRTVIEACMDPTIPILRWEPPAAGFVDWDDDQRHREMRDWLVGNLQPIMDMLPIKPSWFGEDFGRSIDLTVIWPLQEALGLTYHTPFVFELRDCPFSQQEQALFFLGDRLPRFSGGALDANGNGSFLAERARQHWSPDVIEQSFLRDAWCLDAWPKTKAYMEDKSIIIPKDDLILDDFRAVKKVRGVPRVPRHDRTEHKDGGKRHGDAAVAAALAVYAANTFEPGGDVSYTAARKTNRKFAKGAW
jgi:Mu-like prophage FluMu protein gp28